MSTFDGFIREFEGLIRVDNFHQSNWLPTGCRPSLVYLLSHAHSDHMVDLEQFTGSTIYCSDITRDIVRKIRPFQARSRQAAGLGNTTNERTYKNLFHNNHSAKNGDLLKPIPLRYSQTINLPTPDADQCRITLLPANHCPGSVMFLIQMWGRNVLYTGDIRAEPWWVESLTKESILAPYVVPPRGLRHQLGEVSFESPTMTALEPHTRLDNIYLDTSSLLTKIEVLTKEEALSVTIEMMALYPSETNFFINAWTWGYEELLERIAVYFQTSIHVDEYKFEIFSQPNFKLHFPLLSGCITLDHTKTRFHACERKWRCFEDWDGSGAGNAFQPPDFEKPTRRTRSRKPRIVNVNPWEITRPHWNDYKKSIDAQLAKARLSSDRFQRMSRDPWPPLLICPLTRHSSFTEILNFVSAFRPKKIFPNTTHPYTGFIEFYAIPKLFGPLLPPQADREMKLQARKFIQDYELRGQSKLRKRTISVSSFDWKGVHRGGLEKVFRYFEEVEFRTAKYQSMWNEFFQVSDPNHKQQAADFIEGRTTTSSTHSIPIEIIEIESDEDDAFSRSLSPCARASGLCGSSKKNGVDTDESAGEQLGPQEAPGVVVIDDHTSAPPVVDLPIQSAESSLAMNKQKRLSPKLTTPPRSTSLAETAEPCGHSSSSFEEGLHSLSHYAAVLQMFECEFLRHALQLSDQLSQYDPSNFQLDQNKHIEKGRLSVARSSVNYGQRHTLRKKHNSRHNHRWKKIRNLIVQLISCRSEIIQVRQIAIAKLYSSTA